MRCLHFPQEVGFAFNLKEPLPPPGPHRDQGRGRIGLEGSPRSTQLWIKSLPSSVPSPPPPPLPHLLSSHIQARLPIYFPHTLWEKGTIVGFFVCVCGGEVLFCLYVFQSQWAQGEASPCECAAALLRAPVSPSGTLPGDTDEILGLPLDCTKCP